MTVTGQSRGPVSLMSRFMDSFLPLAPGAGGVGGVFWLKMQFSNPGNTTGRDLQSEGSAPASFTQVLSPSELCISD